MPKCDVLEPLDVLLQDRQGSLALAMVTRLTKRSGSGNGSSRNGALGWNLGLLITQAGSLTAEMGDSSQVCARISGI